MEVCHAHGLKKCQCNKNEAYWKWRSTRPSDMRLAWALAHLRDPASYSRSCRCVWQQSSELHHHPDLQVQTPYHQTSYNRNKSVSRTFHNYPYTFKISAHEYLLSSTLINEGSVRSSPTPADESYISSFSFIIQSLNNHIAVWESVFLPWRSNTNSSLLV